MTAELDKLRYHFGNFLMFLFWGHVPLIALVAWVTGHNIGGGAGAAALMAAIYHLYWKLYGTRPVTRYLSAVALMGEPALLLYMMHGHLWQMDMHMYFFAMLALLTAWCDRRAILVGAVTVATHHLVLLYALPYAVFATEGSLARVLLHATIVAFQTAVLIWFSNMLVSSFARINQMSAEIMTQNEELAARTEEAEQANKAKSLFLANMSHEIRTPMNAILGFCHLAMRTGLNPKQLDYVNKINNAGQALLRLVNDILDFSKNEAGKLKLEMRPFNPHRAIEQQMLMVEKVAEENGTTLRCDISPDIPAGLIGDELRFNQVVLNLLSNAIKFSPKGSVGISAILLSDNGNEAVLKLSITDTGIGMTSEEQARLFNSFTQADSSTTRRFGGTGLGLAICKQIVTLMDGDIEVRSTLGEGSVFSFTASFRKGEAEVITTPPLPTNLAALRVLAADDNPAARQIIEEVFTAWGIHVDMVSSGMEALGALETATTHNTPYDLILLDWKMPGMDGMATLEAMRDNPSLGNIPPTIMVTAYNSDELSPEVQRTEISAIVSKPLDPNKLLETLSALFPDPVQKADEPAVEEEDGTPKVAAHLRGLTVLLVEDNDINREIAMELLSDAGLLVDIAENGKIACDKVAAQGDTYAAILMDVQMPEMDGITATRHIRETWQTNRLPIIALTAHAYEEERERCANAGMNDHVSKPVSPRNLVAALNKWMKPKEGNGVQSQAATVAPPTPQDLPDDLPPYDIKTALSRVNGKAPLLRKLIVSFGDSYADAIDRLKQYEASGAREDARRLAHTLKGVAGSLGLPQLYDAAARLERTYVDGDSVNLPARVDEVASLLAPAIVAAKSLSAPADAAPFVAPAPDTDPQQLSAAGRHLREQIRLKKLGARNSYNKLADLLGYSDEHRRQHPVGAALDQLDYDNALSLLNTGTDALSATTREEEP